MELPPEQVWITTEETSCGGCRPDQWTKTRYHNGDIAYTRSDLVDAKVRAAREEVWDAAIRLSENKMYVTSAVRALEAAKKADVGE